jgi:orotate phosphoribosyltransferase
MIEEQKDDTGSVPLPFGKQTVVRSLFVRQDFILHSGQNSDFKIECDALTDNDWECLAYLISKQVSFDSVRGVPNGGNKLAKALQKYSTNTWTQSILIVDDVLTTGRSMEEMKSNLIANNPKHYEEVWFKGFVVFARGECPKWVKAVFKIGDCT